MVSIFFNMEVYCVLSLESPQEVILMSTHNILFLNIQKQSS